MTPKLEEKIRYLFENIPHLIRSFNYRKGPDLYFYKRVSEIRKKSALRRLFEDTYFFELLYATLTAWDMNARGAKMKYYDEFKQNLYKNKDLFFELEKFKLSQLTNEQFLEVKEKLGNLYDNLHLMKTGGRLVSNSKIMHFILPDLIMPMDRQNTLRFFFGHTLESRNKFLTIFECSYLIASKLNVAGLFDSNWNFSIPKIIDNAIICSQSAKYRKQIDKIKKTDYSPLFHN